MYKASCNRTRENGTGKEAFTILRNQYPAGETEGQPKTPGGKESYAQQLVGKEKLKEHDTHTKVNTGNRKEKNKGGDSTEPDEPNCSPAE